VTEELIVRLADERVARLQRARTGRVELEYEPAWQTRTGAYPLSLSMPLAARRHPAKVVEPYLWGLLPDNELILERWAQQHRVSARSAFALLRWVGEDCPGAVRILHPERDARGDDPGGVAWLEESDIAARLRALRADASAWRMASDTGRFSLAGAQPKTALWFDGTRWGVPYGSTPTTHILKPGVVDLEGSAQNEHLCLAVAQRLGLPVARSWIAQFEDEVAIVVERWDRVTTRAGVLRVHQEDVCQALAVHPARKYENDGGPGARAIVALLSEVSSRAESDVDTFLGALVFSWLIAGTDAHAKNYSLLIGAEGRARLAPLYDVASALPYPELSQQKLKLAMRIGGKYRLRDIGRHQWRKLGAELTLDPERVLSMARSYAGVLPEAATAVLDQARADGLGHPILGRLHAALCERARRCAAHIGP
jgi:serine/threonine-protein kinase HipA